MTKSTQHKDTIFDKITANFVEAIEKVISGEETVPAWVRPWSVIGSPRNAFTNRPYKGFNPVILGMMASLRGWDDLRFAPFNAIKKAGGKVKKGSKGIGILKPVPVKDKDTGEIKFMHFSCITVFNVKAQTEGIELKAIETPNKDERDEKLEAYIEASEAKIMHGGDSAYYSPTQDHIGMPPFKHFNTGDAYYSTLFHEMTHWTGHPERLNRPLDAGFFGNTEYAFEELVAELGNAFLCQELGVDGEFQENHLAYLKSWLKALQNDPKAIQDASKFAKKATEFVLGKMGYAKEEEETTEEVREEVTA